MEWSAEAIGAAVGALVTGILGGAGVVKLQRKPDSVDSGEAVALMTAINRLGEKVDEVIRQGNTRKLVQDDLVRDLEEIKHDVSRMKPDIEGIRRDFDLLKPEVAQMRSRLAGLELRMPPSQRAQ